jgi:acyl carrier protein
VDGAWYLHDLTQHRDLDFFVLFSAGATLLGTAGQGSYVAANAFLDGLAHWRQANHLPALSINWGNWTRVGMAAAMSDEHRMRLAEQGLTGIEPSAGLTALERALTLTIPHVAVLSLDRTVLDERRRQHAGIPTLLSDLATAAVRSESSPVVETIRAQVEQAPLSQRRGLLLTHVRERLGHVLRLDPRRTIDPRQPLTEIGLDSLMAVELRNSLVASTGAQLSPTLLFDYPTLEALVEHMLADHIASSPSSRPEVRRDEFEAARSATMHQLERLSEDEAEQLLLAELGLSR